jgi:hypothetical protein
MALQVGNARGDLLVAYATNISLISFSMKTL